MIAYQIRTCESYEVVFSSVTVVYGLNGFVRFDEVPFAIKKKKKKKLKNNLQQLFFE
jgi:hypothetical protein